MHKCPTTPPSLTSASSSHRTLRLTHAVAIYTPPFFALYISSTRKTNGNTCNMMCSESTSPLQRRVSLHTEDKMHADTAASSSRAKMVQSRGRSTKWRLAACTLPEVVVLEPLPSKDAGGHPEGRYESTGPSAACLSGETRARERPPSPPAPPRP